MSIPRLLALVAVVLLGTSLALGAYLDASKPRPADARPHAAQAAPGQASSVSRAALPCTGVRSASPRPVRPPVAPTASAPRPPAELATPAPRLLERTPARASAAASVTHAPATRAPSASAPSWGVRSALEQLPSVHSAVTIDAPAPSWEPTQAEPECTLTEEAVRVLDAPVAPGPLGQTTGF
jgi:hypothetical protein